MESMQTGTSTNQAQAVPVGSTWGLKQNIIRVFWMLIGRTLQHASPTGAHGYRCLVLRLFGAKIGRNVRIARDCRIDIPWTLEIADNVTVGDRAILYSLGPIRIGEGTVIERFAHLCAGSHDYTRRTFDLTRPPITVGRGCFIGTDAFIGPGVTLGDGSIIEPRASLFKGAEAGARYAGNPARKAEPQGAS